MSNEVSIKNDINLAYNLNDVRFLDDIEEFKVLDTNIFNSLKQRTLNIFLSNSTNNLLVGHFLNEIEADLKQYGLFNVYLKKIKINEATAWRYRIKAKLFSECTTDYAKKTILKLNHNQLQILHTYPDLKKEVLEHIHNGTPIETIKYFIQDYLKTLEEPIEDNEETEEIVDTDDNAIEIIDFEPKFIMEEVEQKWQSLESDKKKKVKKLLDELHNLITE